MRPLSTVRPIAVIMTAIFLLSLFMGSVHAADYGDHQDHDGVACDVMVMADEIDAVAPPAPIMVTPLPLEPARFEAAQPDAVTTVHPARAPPPRAPPA